MVELFRLERPTAPFVVFGFDSAWTDNPRAPGAICAIACDGSSDPRFVAPRLASFEAALAFIADVGADYALRLIAIDQPTIVPNLTGCRPVERVAGSLISFVGGGVQPANRGKTAMFGDAAPLWRFKASLGASDDPERARSAESGLFLIEVFPALALPALHPPFAERLSGPKYNPANCQRRRESRPRGGAKPGQWLGAERHGPRAHHIAGVGHGALAGRAKFAAADQAVASAFWARL